MSKVCLMWRRFFCSTWMSSRLSLHFATWLQSFLLCRSTVSTMDRSRRWCNSSSKCCSIIFLIYASTLKQKTSNRSNMFTSGWWRCSPELFLWTSYHEFGTSTSLMGSSSSTKLLSVNPNSLISLAILRILQRPLLEADFEGIMRILRSVPEYVTDEEQLAGYIYEVSFPKWVYDEIPQLESEFLK